MAIAFGGNDSGDKFYYGQQEILSAGDVAIYLRVRRGSSTSQVARVLEFGGNGYLVCDYIANRFSVRFPYTTTNKEYGYTLPTLDAWVNIAVSNPASPTAAPSVWYDGVLQTPNTSIQGSGTIVVSATHVNIGNSHFNPRGFLGELADIAFCNGVSAEGDRTAFNAGFSPLYFAHRLRNYWPLVHDGVDLLNGEPTTIGGAPSVVDHPVVFGPPKTTLALAGSLPVVEPPPVSSPPVITNVDGETGTGVRLGFASIDGTEIGAFGQDGSIFGGYRLWWGDTFNKLPESASPVNQMGRYGPNKPDIPRRRNQTDAKQFNVDDAYYGASSQLSEPAPFGGVLTSVDGVLTITARAPTAGELEYLPNNYTAGSGDANNKPRLLGAEFDAWNSMMIAPGQSSYILCAKMQVDPNVPIRGYWPAVWHSTIMNWPDKGEVDLYEGRISGGIHRAVSVLNISSSDGAGNTSTTIADVACPDNRPFTMAVRKVGDTLTFFNDFAQEGTIVEAASYTNARVSRLRGAHRLRFGLAVQNAWDNSSFNAADWPAFFKISALQVWAPNATYSEYTSPEVLNHYAVNGGDAFSATLPALSALWPGKVIVEEVASVSIHDEDLPGLPISGGLASGMTWNTSSRELTWAVPTGKGGRVGFVLAGVVEGQIGVESRVLYFNVAPSVTGELFANQAATVGSPLNISIPYVAFHSGNLPHEYAVTHDAGEWLTVAYGANNTSATLTGTPLSAGVVNIEITATNSAGQQTTETRVITVNES